jgi:four helix bundle protein
VIPKVYDLQERTARFGEEVIAFARSLVRDSVSRPLISQVVRSATSVGANYMEADGAFTKKEFQHRISLCRKESKETEHRLRMIGKANAGRAADCQRLSTEAHEPTLTFSSILIGTLSFEFSFFHHLTEGHVKNHILLSLILLLVVGAASVSAQGAAPSTLKIGFVNSSKILKEYPEAAEAQKKLEVFGKKIQDSLEAMSAAYEAKLKEYQQKQGLMTDAAKQTAQQELLAMEQRAMDYRERQLGRDGEYNKYQEKLLDPIFEKVKKQIEGVAKEEKLSFVFDKTESIQILLYGHQSFDYTFRVIDKLKRK